MNIRIGFESLLVSNPTARFLAVLLLPTTPSLPAAEHKAHQLGTKAPIQTRPNQTMRATAKISPDPPNLVQHMFGIGICIAHAEMPTN